MRLAFTSDVHTDVNGPDTIDALAARFSELRPDVAVIAGDIATAPTTLLKTLLALRSVVPRVLVIAGNHDVWTSPELAAQGLDSWGRLDKLLPALAMEAGAESLDNGPVVVGDIGFVGSLGWFDYSTRDPQLDVGMEAYHLGAWGPLRWMDQVRAIWLEEGQRMTAEEVAERLRRRFEQQLVACEAPRIVAVTHMLPFAAQVHHRDSPGWRFVNAFMGHLALGEVIAGDPRVELAIAGHTHLPSDVRVGGLRAVVSPLGYRREWMGASLEEAVRRAVQLIEL